MTGGGELAPAAGTGTGVGTGVTPSVAGQTGTTGTTQAGQTGTTQAAAGAGQMPDITDLSAKVRWLGPLAAIGGAGLAIWGFTKGKNWAKFAGISTGLSGIATTAMGFKAAGIQTGKAAGYQQGVADLTQQVQAQIGPMIDQQNQKIAQQQQLIQQLTAQQGTGSTGTGTGTPGTGATGTGTPGTGTPGTGTTGTDPNAPAATGTPAQEIPAGQWTPAALTGQAVTLGVANMASGQTVAEAGPYVIVQQAGDPAGYASQAEADAAAQGSMSTNLQGTKNYRWLVVEHGGKYYGFVAQKDVNSSPQLPAANGNLVAWHALRAVETGAMQVQWMHYSWNKDTGGSFAQVGNLDPTAQQATAGAPATAAAGGGGTTSSAPAANTPIGGTATGANTPVNGAQPGASTTASPATTGGGAASSPAWPAASLIGSGLSVDTADGVTGGVLQLQSLLGPSVAGFETVNQAADAIRLDRNAHQAGDSWRRWVTVQGADGKYYAYAGHIVRRDVAAIGNGSSAVNVFGDGFAEYFDGSAWHAQADAGL